jgi:hypothetical protein
MIPGLEYESASFDNGNGCSTTDHHHQQQQYPSSYVDYGGATTSSPGASSVNSYSSINLNTPSSSSHTTSTPTGYPELRRRQIRPDNNDNNGFGYASPNYDTNNKGNNNNKSSSSVTKLAKKLDVFPKTERDYTIRTDRGGQLTAIGYGIMLILILAEYTTWKNMNSEHNEHIIVDTR